MSLVSFPAVTSRPVNGSVLRIHSRFSNVEVYQHPQLLYHVQVARGPELIPDTGNSFPVFLDALPNWGPRLSAVYGIADQTIYFIPRECSPHYDGPQPCDINLSQIPTRFNGSSWNLAAAIGVAAVLLDARVPHWVSSSGSLSSNAHFDPDLRLIPTLSYERKIRLCGGLPPDYAADSCEQWLCQEPAQCDMHGERAQRGLPGQIRLLLLARWEADGDDRNGMSRQTRAQLGLVSCPDLVAAIATRGFDAVIGSLPVDRMLVLLVPTVWHALLVLGLRVPNLPTDIHITETEITALLAPR